VVRQRRRVSGRFPEQSGAGRLKKAAFELHQAAERFYPCLILVRTLYSPRTHSLNRLRKLAEELEPRLVEVWSRDSKFERRSCGKGSGTPGLHVGRRNAARGARECLRRDRLLDRRLQGEWTPHFGAQAGGG
jgi:HEPN domain-containing protein